MINTTLVSNTIQPKYSKKLLEKATPLVVLIDYAAQEELPPNEGAMSMTFFQPPSADLTATGAPVVLTEGTPPANDRDISFTPIEVPLVQIGQKGSVSDIATNVGLLKYLDSVIDLFGDEFALDVDTRLRNQLIHPSTGFKKRYAQGAANFAALAAASTATGCATPRDFLDSQTALKLARAPRIQGHYVAVVPPQMTRDISNSADWREVVRNQYADKIFKNEIGDLFGLRLVEANNPFQEDETEGTFAQTLNTGGTNTNSLIYSAVITGKGGFGAVNMKKMGASMKKPTMIILTGADKSDPLNQKTVVGWKAYWGSKVLNRNWGITLRTKSQFVDSV